MRTRAIYGCAGLTLSDEERVFFRQAQPWGFIVFARNIADRVQLRALCDALRETVGDAQAPILVDQEGGRVARLKPPEWKTHAPARAFGALYANDPEKAREAAYLNARLLAHDLTEVGLNVDCLPVLDVPVEGAHDIIGDRAFAVEPATIIDLGRKQIEGLLDGGVLPVMKHIPGHGRAGADSHLELPRVTASLDALSAADFVTFRSLSDCPLAMTAHVVYEAIDAARPATTSHRVIRDVIRGEIGFDGLLLSDDISMQALTGSIAARTRAALFAGCDVVLHCNGGFAEMGEVAEEAGPLEGASLKRAQAALAHLHAPGTFNWMKADKRLSELMAVVA
ncbi:MAG TPA: beta-N-acetylhexosaminidase [Rhizomicrobium sp.]|nr:beta-N-acetylhexosaminidase [Rhizomicrobium sp.]